MMELAVGAGHREIDIVADLLQPHRALAGGVDPDQVGLVAFLLADLQRKLLVAHAQDIDIGGIRIEVLAQHDAALAVDDAGRAGRHLRCLSQQAQGSAGLGSGLISTGP